MYKSKIIIFGGQGYIGTNLINFLKKKETEIISIGRNANLNKNNNTDNIYKFVKTFKTDFFNLKNLDKINFDHSTIIFSGLNGKVSNKTFALQFTKLIKFLNKKKIKRIILLSSISVYGIKKNKVSEKSKTRPINNYGKNCLVAEAIIKNELSDKKNYIILRIANVFGSYRNNLSVIEKIIFNNLYANKYKFYKKNIKRSYISVSNLAEIIFILSKKRNLDNIYNVSNPFYIYSFNELKGIFNSKFNFDKKYHYNSYEPSIVNSIIDTSKLENIYTFKDNFYREIKKVINYYKKK